MFEVVKIANGEREVLLDNLTYEDAYKFIDNARVYSEYYQEHVVICVMQNPLPIRNEYVFVNRETGEVDFRLFVIEK